MRSSRGAHGEQARRLLPWAARGGNITCSFGTRRCRRRPGDDPDHASSGFRRTSTTRREPLKDWEAVFVSTEDCDITRDAGAGLTRGRSSRRSTRARGGYQNARWSESGGWGARATYDARRTTEVFGSSQAPARAHTARGSTPDLEGLVGRTTSRFNVLARRGQRVARRIPRQRSSAMESRQPAPQYRSSSRCSTRPPHPGYTRSSQTLSPRRDGPLLRRLRRRQGGQAASTM